MRKHILLSLLLFCVVNLNATEYFVTTKGDNGNNGLSENSSFRNLEFAVGKAKAGDIVWIKAGNYGKENVVFKVNGEVNNLISFIGYKDIPGDINSNYYKYGVNNSLDSKQMPLFDGGNRGEGIGFKMYGKSYIQIKNVQITNYRYCIDALSGANNLIFDNVIASNSGGTSAFPPVSGGNCFRMDTYNNHDNKIINCLVMNATMVAITVGGDNNVIENNRTYADQDDINGDKRSMDYHVLVSGSNNIVKNHYAEHVGDLKHTGHGIVLKTLAGTVAVENNVIENCEVININGSIEFRHRKVKNNIARNIRIRRVDSRYAGGFHFRDGASSNIVENSHVSGITGLNGGISFYDTVEDGGTQWAGNDNIIRNTIFESCDLGIRVGSSKTPADTNNNKILNCTFYKVKTMIGFWPNSKNSNNLIQNCIISESNLRYHKNIVEPGWTELNNNYFKNDFNNASGKGNQSNDPEFIDVSRSNFRLKPSSKLIDAGEKINDVKKDFDGIDRPQGISHDIGAFEYKESSTSSVEADAGPDQSLCIGEQVTLVASGGTSYRWSNGATTKSITVSPTETTTYIATATEGSSSDTDEVIVTVNEVKANAGSDVTINIGESITLVASGGDSYLWDNGETTASISVLPSSTTTYSVTVSKNGCEATDQIEVKVNTSSFPVVDSVNAGEDQTICLGEEVTLTADGGSSYLWSTGEVGNQIVVNPQRTETYNVTTELNGVTVSDSVIVTVKNCISDADDDSVEGDLSIQLYPNPTSGIIKIKSSTVASDTDMHLININGKILYQETLKSQQGNFGKQLDLSNYTKGIYFLRFFSVDEQLVKKIVLI